MKKNIIVFVLCLIACLAIFYLTYSTHSEIDQRGNASSTTETQSEKAPIGDDILNQQIQKLATNLEVKVTEDKLFQDLNNYKIEIEDLKKNQSKSFVKNYVIKQSAQLVKCLKKDYCGTKADPDGFFDEFATPGHTLLSRELRLLNTMLDDGDLAPSDLAFSELVKFENKNILESTADLFLKSNPSESELGTFLDNSSQLEGAKKQAFYFRLIGRANTSQREILIANLAEELKKSTPYSVVAFFQKISSLKLSEEELVTISRSGCPLKEDNEISWNSFSYNFKKYTSENSFDLFIDEICP
ncbi:hypothetical protein [Halobacteriovorax sp. JY17]|uniref:hypothetical protein n=1 Tax=Halobacteriovorax sp. JY17 TaxID=2014617 RepID=UPI000C694B52|nr:hypothetical protein [Halobacteriovorax sp. JY17]PIK13718.1 MAG: hypothetical protein CES88_16135 [Halobacteriovorax sp. JY17]